MLSGKINGVRTPIEAIIPLFDLLGFQEALLTFNNAFEGQNFVNPAFTQNQTLTQYVELLFPSTQVVVTETSLYKLMISWAIVSPRLSSVLPFC